MATLRTAADVRSRVLNQWREIFPDLLAPNLRISPDEEDPALVRVELLEAVSGKIRWLLLLPVASGEPRVLRGLLPRLREMGQASDTLACFAVPHMGSSGGKLCKEAGIGFVDCCGNVHLRFNQVLVQIGGNRNRFSERKRPRTLFHDKATIPLRMLLEQPEVWLTTREIADRGDLSLGWVSQILQRLHEEGYVERQRGGGTRLVEPHRLLNEWLQEYAFEHNRAYPFRLKDGSVDAALDRLRELKAPLSQRYAVTLDVALGTLSPGSGPPTALHLYLPDTVENEELALEMWSDALELRPAGHGADCFLVNPTYAHGTFFGVRERSGLNVVSDIQLYLDLFHYPVVRREQARATVAARLPFTVEDDDAL